MCSEDIGLRPLQQGLIPYFVIRLAIRVLCRQKVREINSGALETKHEAKMLWIEQIGARTTVADLAANEQHYEVCLLCIGPIIANFI